GASSFWAPPHGTPLSELSWSSSLAVVALSFSGLFTFIFLMLACLCCKKGDIGFKEFENAEGEDYVTELSVQGSPAAQNGPEVYILPLTEVSLPMAKQPGRSVQLLKSTDLGRHSLLYLKEIGHGWFGKVFLGEVNSGLTSTQVVVKELKVSASVQDQMQFLEEAQPYRALQHTNLLQCMAQCAEVTPYLLVMEFCPLGDLKGYLRSCQLADSVAPDPLTLQRMACEVACGIVHLHNHHYVHSDLALRNCFLTADLTVKIGDYGLSHCKYKEDYFVTADQLWVPLRWIAPELIDEVHGNLLVVDQTRSSNVWSLGVTIWELFELGNQPYHRYSDRQVLTYAIKEQQLKLAKPHLKLLLAERWYEVMQFCWLQPEQRPTAEEVYLLLSYLCAKGATEAEDEFERRWNAMKPSSGAGSSHTGPELSSFPLLEQFSAEGFHSDGDDVLTVMETSHGLNFEYKWEPSKAERFQAPVGGLSPCSAAHCQDLLPGPGVVPVLGTQRPLLGSESYIHIGEPLDGSVCSYSPDGEHGSPATASRWRAGVGHGRSACDPENSPAVSLTLEPLLGHAPPCEGSWEHPDYYPYHCRGKESPYSQPSPGHGTDWYLLEEPLEAGRTEWWVPSFQKNIFEDPLAVSPSVNCAYGEPHPAPLVGRLLECEGQRAASRTQGSTLDCVTLELGEESPCSSPCPCADCTQVLSEAFEAAGQVPRDIAVESGKSITSDLDRTPDKTVSSASFPDMDDCSDEDTTELTSGVFTDFSGDYVERVDVAPSFKSLQKQVGTPDSLESLDIPSTASSCEVFSPSTYIPSSQPKALDSGYDTENYESPEFVLKEPHEPREPEAFTHLGKSAIDLVGGEGDGMGSQMHLSSSFSAEFHGLNKNPHRDSAYFSDYDTEAERPQEAACTTGAGAGFPMAGEESIQAACSPQELDGAEEGAADHRSDLDSSQDTTVPSVPSKPFFLAPVVVSPEVSGASEEPVQDGLSRPLGEAAASSSKSEGPEVQLGPEGEAQNGPDRPLTEEPSLDLSLQQAQTELQPPSPERREEAEDEEDTEDSDESDEELRCYNIQEQSEESEDELAMVPIVVAETHSAQNLRSLLKMPSLLSQSFCEDLERKKKAVSFYDDVTVYLFDQVSTRHPRGRQEIHTEHTGSCVSGRSSNCGPAGGGRAGAGGHQLCCSLAGWGVGLLPDGSLSSSAAGGGFEWENDFPLMPVKSPFMSSLTVMPVGPVPSLPALAPAQKQVLPLQFSRFSVSPAPISRFSITHVADPAVEAVGGEAGLG
uniref:non-specific serine/threonine protein kinase n=1 Tax=Pelusios castaneus TaxID=367368 RepID=A0A8C8RZQ6_9SAUR